MFGVSEAYLWLSFGHWCHLMRVTVGPLTLHHWFVVQEQFASCLDAPCLFLSDCQYAQLRD